MPKAEKKTRALHSVLCFVLYLFSAAMLKAEEQDRNSVAGNSRPARADSTAAFCSAGKSACVLDVFDFADNLGRDTLSSEASLYVKWGIETEKSNSIVNFIPSLSTIKSGKEELNEYYSRISLRDLSLKDAAPVARAGTFIHNKRVFPTITKFLIPDIYSKTLFNGNTLSPFNRANRKYYKYSALPCSDSTVLIHFKPRKTNTQLVSGSAVSDKSSGRILSAEINGNYDMMDFRIKTGMDSCLFPARTDLEVDFRFLGNRINSRITSIVLPPADFGERGIPVMDSLRPLPLTSTESEIYEQSINNSLKSKDIQTRKHSGTVWKGIGNTLFNSFRTDLGENQEFHFRSSPLLNPSYLSYSQRKGISYRMDLNGRYVISDNSDFLLKTRLGYMFNKRQFYFDIPFTLNYNAKKHGTIGLAVGNGNRIKNSSVKEQLKMLEQFFPSLEEPDFDYYTDMHLRANTSRDITDRLSFNFCIDFHKRSPVKKEIYAKIGQPTAYRTFSPMLELKYRPLKDRGPVFTLDYEKGIKGVFKSGIEYQKIETDAEWLVPLAPLSSLSMRLGGGFYANKSDGVYFLDYSNFKDNNLPGGWNDDWSGEFQLLNPVFYNVSDYYLRSNLTFEHPMLLASYIPWGGKYIETERLYVNTLIVERIHPYTEFGYGFTNSFFSMGVYASFKNWNFERVGLRFTLEIFSAWN